MEQIVKKKEDAYTLGYLWADGHLGKQYNLNIKINETDANEIFDTFMLFEDFHIYNSDNSKANPTWQNAKTFYKTNNIKYKILENHGFTEKCNISHEKIMPLIPAQFEPYFWRGFFDGDGCIYLRKKEKLGQLCFASSYEQDWSYLQKLLNDIGIVSKIKFQVSKKGHKSSCLRVTGKYSIIKFLEYIYPNGHDFGLKRKFDKLNKLKQWTNEKDELRKSQIQMIKDNIFLMPKEYLYKKVGLSEPAVNRIIRTENISCPPKNYWWKNRYNPDN
jgi:hypothetical protein